MKESYGRRREVMLRIKMNGREERIAEGLKRWVRRGDELVSRLRASSSEENEEYSSLLDMAQHARILLESLESGVLDEQAAISLSGAKARYLLANASLERLFDELRDEKAMRIELEKELAIQAGWPKDDVPRPLESDMIEERPIFSANVDAPLPPTPIEEETSPIEDSSSVSFDTQADLPIDKPDGSNVNAQETTKELSASETKIEVELSEEPVHFPASNFSRLSSEITEITSGTHSLPLSANAITSSAQGDTTIASSSTLISTLVGSNLHGNILHQIDRQPTKIEEKAAIILEPTAMVPESLSVEEDIAHVAQPQLDEQVVEVPPFEGNVSLIPALSPPSSIVSSDSRTDTPLLDTPPILEPPTETSLEERHIFVDPIYDPNPISSPSSLSSPVSTPTTTKADLLISSGNEGPLSVPAELTTELKEDIKPLISLEPILEPASKPSPSPLLSPLPLPSPKPSKFEPHPLLADLARVNQRYDQLQKSFRDCHLALEGLKNAFGSSENSGSLPSSSSSAYGGGIGRGHPSSSPSSVHFPSSVGNGSNHEYATNSLPVEVLRAALARLDDYTEDARVELEIRIGDEEMAVKGWEALLSVPGALVSDRKSLNSDIQDDDNTLLIKEDDEDHLVPFQTEVEEQIKAFISGDDPAIKKARDGFERKLEDVLHDIAVLKRVVYDPAYFDFSGNSGLSTDELSSSASNSNLSVNLDNANGESLSPSSASMALPNTTSSSGWTSWIRSPSLVSSRSSSPAPTPTFGSIMTTPRSPLRHSSSNVSLRSAASQDHPFLPFNQQRPRKGSFFGFSLPLGAGGEGEHDKTYNPLSQLGLRVPMPNLSAISGRGTSVISPSAVSPLTPGIGSARTRTVSSTMYMLGLSQGVKSPGIGLGNAMGLARSVSAGGPAYSSLKFPHETPMRMNRQVSEPVSSSGSRMSVKGTNGVAGVEEMTEDDDDEGSEGDDDDDDTDVE